MNQDQAEQVLKICVFHVSENRKAHPMLMCPLWLKELRYLTTVEVLWIPAFCSWASSTQWTWFTHQRWSSHVKCSKGPFLSLTFSNYHPKFSHCETNLCKCRGSCIWLLAGQSYSQVQCLPRLFVFFILFVGAPHPKYCENYIWMLFWYHVHLYWDTEPSHVNVLVTCWCCLNRAASMLCVKPHC